MKIRGFIITVTAACVLFFGVAGYAGWWPFDKKEGSYKQDLELTEIDWDDLIPDDFIQPENPFESMSSEQIDKLMDGSDESNATLEKLEKEFNYAPVVDELHGKRVKIAAYITPLEFDGQTRLSEFLLVPYVGACMHTPPPPANQVVHAVPYETVELKSIYDPVWAIGRIRTETVKSDLAESGYRLDVEEILPYSKIE